MTNPLRKEHDDLTTADIAQPHQRPSDADIREGRPMLVRSERSETDSPSQEAPNPATSGDSKTTPLFSGNDLEGLRTDWNRVQAGFVDEPRKAVEQADGLVASTMKRLAEGFARERANLEQQWDHGDNVSTEDLRIALQRYRSFFHRLMAM